MFSKSHMSKSTDGIPLAFLKSLNVCAYPCGRRRSEQIGVGATAYYLPFDPEARLNTEANNIKHSGINGFTQSFLDIKERIATVTVGGVDTTKKVIDKLSVVIAGYLFNIKVSNNYTLADFCDNLFMQLTTTPELPETEAGELENSARAIYANIRLSDVKLYDGFERYFTSVLRDQEWDDQPSASLDLFRDGAGDNMEDASAYYFSGLSFSTAPLTGTAGYPVSTITESLADGATSTIVSLHIFTRSTSTDVWVPYQPAILPRIVHGQTEDSIKIYGNLTVDDNIDCTNLKVTDRIQQTVEIGGIDTNISSPALRIEQKGTGDNPADKVWQLQFFKVDKKEL